MLNYWLKKGLVSKEYEVGIRLTPAQIEQNDEPVNNPIVRHSFTSFMFSVEFYNSTTGETIDTDITDAFMPRF